MSPERLNNIPPRKESRAASVRQCILICLTNGWAPPAEAIWEMVALQEAVLKGERSDGPFPGLEFARYLHRTGRISG